jgi:hypothetical protein
MTTIWMEFVLTLLHHISTFMSKKRKLCVEEVNVMFLVKERGDNTLLETTFNLVFKEITSANMIWLNCTS